MSDVADLDMLVRVYCLTLSDQCQENKMPLQEQLSLCFPNFKS